MALAGNWKSSVSVESGALKQGTGWNPVHAIHDASGRNIAPNAGATLDDVIPYGLADHEAFDNPSDTTMYGYVAEDYAVYGLGPQTGTDDRPRWDEGETWRHDSTLMTETPWPAWGPYENGIPGGDSQRHDDHGTLVTRLSKQNPTETVSEGWEDKVHLPEPEDAVTSDLSQYTMQTSMQQRDKARSGSQTSGRASEFAATVRSRMVGMRIKPWSGGQRHYDMQPREASELVRPWWGRTAGTADPSLMAPNEMVVRTPITRQVPAEPDQGATASQVTPVDYGYVAEDAIPYA